MKTYPLVSIIILNWNGLKDTIRCLRSLKKTKYRNIEICVLDNGSTKREDLELKKLFPQKKFRFFRSNTNVGFSGGNNMVVPKCRGPYVVLLNNDTEVTPSWLDSLVKTAKNNPIIAVIQPKIKWLKDRRKFDYAGACGGFIDIFGHMFTRGRIFETMEIDNGQYDAPIEIFWACGAAFFVRRSVFVKLRGFDPGFFNYSEEVDFCWRVKKMGLKICSQPLSVIYHKVASTAQANLYFKRYLEHRNNLFVLVKNYPTTLLLFLLPVRLILEVISIGYYESRGNHTFARAAFYSLVHLFIQGFPYLRARKPSGRYRFINDPTVYKGSIVKEYFLNRKLKYSEL